MFPTPSSPFVDVYETVAAGWEFGLVLWGAGGFALLLGVVWGWKWVSRLFSKAAIAGGGGVDRETQETFGEWEHEYYEDAFGEMIEGGRASRENSIHNRIMSENDMLAEDDWSEANRAYTKAGRMRRPGSDYNEDAF